MRKSRAAASTRSGMFANRFDPFQPLRVFHHSFAFPLRRCAAQTYSIPVRPNDHEGSKQWFVSTVNLKQVSSPFFITCKNMKHYRWPPSRQRCYTFGREFNRAIDCIVWPLSLQQLTFGSYLNESIDVARLPLSLQRLVFGSSFN